MKKTFLFERFSCYNLEMSKRVIEIAKIRYKKIEKIFCPFFQQNVYCTSSGFNHLIYKSDRSRRSEKEIYARMEAVEVLELILSNSGTLQEKESRDNGQTFYAFIAILNDKKYKVVVSNSKDGRFVFKSIIPRWKTGKRDSINYQTKNSPNK